MIRRRFDGDYLLITQEEHARIAADIALALGGAISSAGQPADLAAALRIHSTGFTDIDARPPLCPAGRPANFDELPLPALLEAWSNSAEAALSFGHYPAMLVSILTLQRSAAIATGARSLREHFQINKLQHRQIEIQEQLRAGLGLRNDLPMQSGLPEPGTPLTDRESSFYRDYRLMLFCIQLALEFCARRNLVGTLAPVPAAPAGHSLTISYHLANPAHGTLDPFPFVSPLTITITGRRVPASMYDHDRELLSALETADELHLAITLEHS